MTSHRSTAFVMSIVDRDRPLKRAPGRHSTDQITDQFRFIVRLAFACHKQNVSYDVVWTVQDHRMSATITAVGKIPAPKPLPKPKEPKLKLKLVSAWAPVIWDAEYRLDAYYDYTRNKMCPGFVIAHSCGLSLVHPSQSGELGVGEFGADEDIRQKWSVTHTASGLSFGLTLNFQRATAALLLAASFAIDWMQDAKSLRSKPEARRAALSAVTTYGTARAKEAARQRLAELEAEVSK